MTSGARDELLAVAERLFSEHGFAGVTLRDIGTAAGLHHSSLYHHAPRGKVQLFVEAVERGLERHGRELRAAIDPHSGDVRAQLYAVAGWLLSGPAGNHARMLTTDLPNLPAATADRIARDSWLNLVGPIAEALRAADTRSEISIDSASSWLVAAALVASLQGLQVAVGAYPGPVPVRRQGERLVDVFLDGVRPRP